MHRANRSKYHCFYIETVDLLSTKPQLGKSGGKAHRTQPRWRVPARGIQRPDGYY